MTIEQKKEWIARHMKETPVPAHITAEALELFSVEQIDRLYLNMLQVKLSTGQSGEC
jgi:hypothetical protein